MKKTGRVRDKLVLILITASLLIINCTKPDSDEPSIPEKKADVVLTYSDIEYGVLSQKVIKNSPKVSGEDYISTRMRIKDFTISPVIPGVSLDADSGKIIVDGSVEGAKPLETTVFTVTAKLVIYEEAAKTTVRKEESISTNINIAIKEKSIRKNTEYNTLQYKDLITYYGDAAEANPIWEEGTASYTRRFSIAREIETAVAQEEKNPDHIIIYDGEGERYYETPEANEGIEIDAETGKVKITELIDVVALRTYTVIARGTGDYGGEETGTIRVTVNPKGMPSRVQYNYNHESSNTIKTNTAEPGLIEIDPDWGDLGEKKITASYKIEQKETLDQVKGIAIRRKSGKIVVDTNAPATRAEGLKFIVTATGRNNYTGEKTAEVTIIIEGRLSGEFYFNEGKQGEKIKKVNMSRTKVPSLRSLALQWDEPPETVFVSVGAEESALATTSILDNVVYSMKFFTEGGEEIVLGEEKWVEFVEGSMQIISNDFFNTYPLDEASSEEELVTIREVPVTIVATAQGDYSGEVTDDSFIIAITIYTVTGEIAFEDIITTYGTVNNGSGVRWTVPPKIEKDSQGVSIPLTVEFTIVSSDNEFAKSGVSIDKNKVSNEDPVFILVDGTVPVSSSGAFTVRASGVGEYGGHIETELDITIEPKELVALSYPDTIILKAGAEVNLAPESFTEFFADDLGLINGNKVEDSMEFAAMPELTDIGLGIEKTGTISGTPAAKSATNYTITAQGKGNYTGEVSKEVNIEVVELKEVKFEDDGKADISELSKTYGDDPFELTTSVTQTGGFTVDKTYSVTSQNPVEGVEGKVVTVSGNKVTIENAGTATVEVTAKAEEDYFVNYPDAVPPDVTKKLTIVVARKSIESIEGEDGVSIVYDENGIIVLKGSEIAVQPNITIPQEFPGSEVTLVYADNEDGPLPNGLEVSSVGGTISGEAKNAQKMTAHVITATGTGNFTGKVNTTVKIEVVELTEVDFVYDKGVIKEEVVDGKKILKILKTFGDNPFEISTSVGKTGEFSVEKAYTIKSQSVVSDVTGDVISLEESTVTDEITGEETVITLIAVKNAGTATVMITATADEAYFSKYVTTHGPSAVKKELTIVVNQKSIENISITYGTAAENKIIALKNSLITGPAPVVTASAGFPKAGLTMSYSLAKTILPDGKVLALPEGLAVLEDGSISGTPKEAKASTDYTIKATGTGNYTGEIDTTVSIEVVGLERVIFVDGITEISKLDKTYGDESFSLKTAVTQTGGFTVSKRYVVSGNVITVDEATGDVTIKNAGTAIVRVIVSANKDYFTNYSGAKPADVTKDLTIEVAQKSIAGITITYDENNAITVLKDFETTKAPTLVFSKGVTATYSGTLPAGLEVSSEDGTISGTPTEAAQAADYTITAEGVGNYSGSRNITVNITVEGINSVAFDVTDGTVNYEYLSDKDKLVSFSTTVVHVGRQVYYMFDIIRQDQRGGGGKVIGQLTSEILNAETAEIQVSTEILNAGTAEIQVTVSDNEATISGCVQNQIPNCVTDTMKVEVAPSSLSELKYKVNISGNSGEYQEVIFDDGSSESGWRQELQKQNSLANEKEERGAVIIDDDFFILEIEIAKLNSDIKEQLKIEATSGDFMPIKEFSPKVTAGASEVGDSNFDVTVTVLSNGLPEDTVPPKGLLLKNGYIFIEGTPKELSAKKTYTFTATGKGNYQGTAETKINIMVAGEFSYDPIIAPYETKTSTELKWKYSPPSDDINYAFKLSQDHLEINSSTGTVSTKKDTPVGEYKEVEVVATYSDTEANGFVTITVKYDLSKDYYAFTFDEALYLSTDTAIANKIIYIDDTGALYYKTAGETTVHEASEGEGPLHYKITGSTTLMEDNAKIEEAKLHYAVNPTNENIRDEEGTISVSLDNSGRATIEIELTTSDFVYNTQEYTLTVTPGNTQDFMGRKEFTFTLPPILHWGCAPFHSWGSNGKKIYGIDNEYKLQRMKEELDGAYELLGDIEIAGDVFSCLEFVELGREELKQDSFGEYIKNDYNYDYDTSGFAPIGSINTPFTGELTGAKYTISELHINRGTEDYVGLFAYAEGATIEKLIIDHSGISGRDNTGALAGAVKNTVVSEVGVITEMASSVTGGNNTGGLVGYGEEGSINGYATGAVKGRDNTGGLAGYVKGSSISGYATGAVTGGNNTGGLAGTVTDSETIASVKGYAAGNVDGNYYIGGLIGQIFGYGTVDGYATGYKVGDKYVPSKVTATNWMGGLIGEASSAATIRGYARKKIYCKKYRFRCDTALQWGYVTGAPEVRNTEFTSVVTYHSATESQYYYRITEGVFTTLRDDPDMITESTLSAGDMGKAIVMLETTTQDEFSLLFEDMESPWVWKGNGSWPAINIGTIKSTDTQPIERGIEYVPEFEGGSDCIAYVPQVGMDDFLANGDDFEAFKKAKKYPYDIDPRNFFATATPDKNSEGVYEIDSWQKLQWMKNCLNGDFKLTDDITFPEQGWVNGVLQPYFLPIGGTIGMPFSGTFDGSGYHIKNFRVYRAAKYHTGLFGVLKDATVKNLIIDLGRGNNLDPDERQKKEWAIYGGSYEIGALAGRSITSTVERVGIVSSVGSRLDNLAQFTEEVPGMLGGLIGRVVGGYVRGFVEVDLNYIDFAKVGGLVGELNGGTVVGYYAGKLAVTNSVHGKTGGLVGAVTSGEVYGYLGSGTDLKMEEEAGGLVGELEEGTVVGYVPSDVELRVATRKELFVSRGGLVGFSIEGYSKKVHGYFGGKLYFYRYKEGGANKLNPMSAAYAIGHGTCAGGGAETVSYYSSNADVVVEVLEGGEEMTVTELANVKAAAGRCSTLQGSAPSTTRLSGFNYGTEIGEWTAVDEGWPALNIGDFNTGQFSESENE